MPEDITEVTDLIGNRLRTQILSLLSGSEFPMTVPQLLEQVTTDRATLRRYLTGLETAGLVSSSASAGHRLGGRGNVVEWRAHKAEIEKIAAKWATYATQGTVTRD